MIILKKPIMIMAFIILASQAAFAHHLWVEKASGDQYWVVRGIMPDSSDPYDPDCVRELKAFGKDGRTLDIKRINKDNRVIFKANGDVAMAAAYSKWGYRVNTTQGKRLMGRARAEQEGLRVISAFFSSHTAKSLFAPSEAAVRSAGLKFEIIPLKDPVHSAPGRQISFKVLFDGKPLPGVSLYTETGEAGTTDDSGIAAVNIPDCKRALLYARHRVNAKNDDRKDYDIYTTFLTFEVNP